MLHDSDITSAVGGIHRRAERQPDAEYVTGTFVDNGIVAQLLNRDHQIVYGRRGTGKTHLLKVLESMLAQDPSTVVCYVDMRMIGSTLQFSDEALPVGARVISLFRDILIEMYNTLLRHAVRTGSAERPEGMEALERFGAVAAEPVLTFSEGTVTTREAAKEARGQGAQGKISFPFGLMAGARSESSQQDEAETTSTVKVTPQDKILFPDLNASLHAALEKAGCKMYLLLDEWSSIPLKVQPYLADFFKRGLLCNPGVTVKIAALEYRSAFLRRTEEGEMTGIEVGSDVTAELDLDDYYVYDRYPDGVAAVFAKMLYSHLSAELVPGYLADFYRSTSGLDLPGLLFTDADAFRHLVRASEGVARDLIVIFTMAYMDARNRSSARIDQAAVARAARKWYDQDKSRNLDDEMRSVLARIIDRVVGEQGRRSFLLPHELERSAPIQRLFDARVLHLMERGFAYPDRPGMRYNIYTLDYGAYVDVLPGCSAGIAGEPPCEDLHALLLANPGEGGPTGSGFVLPETVLG